MSQDEIERLRAFAESIELYAHRHRLLLRMEAGDWPGALSLCQKAMDHCAGLLTEGETASSAASPHRRNLENLRILEAGLRHLAHAGGQGAQPSRKLWYL